MTSCFAQYTNYTKYNWNMAPSSETIGKMIPKIGKALKSTRMHTNHSLESFGPQRAPKGQESSASASVSPDDCIWSNKNGHLDIKNSHCLHPSRIVDRGSHTLTERRIGQKGKSVDHVHDSTNQATTSARVECLRDCRPPWGAPQICQATGFLTPIQ